MNTTLVKSNLEDALTAVSNCRDNSVALRIVEDAIGRAIIALGAPQSTEKAEKAVPAAIVPEGYNMIKTVDGNRLSPMTQYEYDSWRSNNSTCEYAGFTIKAKKDFGEHGFWEPKIMGHIKEGWVVTRDGSNPMPGATWGRTQNEAHQLIDVFLAVEEDGQRFWHLLRAINAGGRK